MSYTPQNGSWLNIAETELSVFSQQCLDRRISRADLLKAELAAWQQERNVRIQVWERGMREGIAKSQE